ncbi:MAG: hypothetical protein ACRDH7_08835 [Actinomycetota bacterium]
MKIVLSRDVIEFIRSRGGRVFVWTVPMQYGYSQASVFALETSIDAHDPSRTFVRFDVGGVDVFFDPGERAAPDELHLALKGRHRERLAAYWNGHSFAT